MTLPPDSSNVDRDPSVDVPMSPNAEGFTPMSDIATSAVSMPGYVHEESASSGTSSAKGKAVDTRDEAVDRARDVKDGAVEVGSHVAEVAKGQAGSVAAEAGDHVKNLLAQSRDELSSQVGVQQQRLAGGLHSLGDEFRSMAQGNENSGVASQLAHQAASRTKSAAGWLEKREPREVLDDVTAFARRRPGVFIAIAAGAGLVVGRLVRGLKDDSSADTVAAGAYAGQPGYGSAYDAPVYAEPVIDPAYPAAAPSTTFDGGPR